MLLFCTPETVTKHIETEYTNINNYLSSGDVEYVKIGEVYRITVKTDEENVEPEEIIQVEQGDSVYISYVIYTFTRGKGNIVDTNIKTIAEKHNLVPIYPDPVKIKYGVSPMLNGFSMGIEGAQKGLAYELIVPFQYGYGDNWFGNIPPYTTLFIEFNISEIKK